MLGRRYFEPGGGGGSSVGWVIVALGLLVLVVGIAVAVAFGPKVGKEGKPPPRPIATANARRILVVVSSDANLRNSSLTIEITRSGSMWPDGGGTELVDMKAKLLPYEEDYVYDATGSGYITVHPVLLVPAYHGQQSMGCVIADPDTPRGISAADAADPLAPVGTKATWEAFCKGTYLEGVWLKQ